MVLRPYTEYVASSFYSLGADRSAATGLPALLAVASDDIGLDRQAIIGVLDRCTTNHFDEARIAFAQAVDWVRAAPCDADQRSGPCRNEASLNAVRAGLQDCRFGDWDPETGARGRPRLDGSYEQTLPKVETKRLYLTSLVPPLVAAGAACISDSCVADQAKRLVVWASEGYENRHQ